MTISERIAIANEMSDSGLNKCYDCCLVPDCYTCGPCDDHTEEDERREYEKWHH